MCVEGAEVGFAAKRRDRIHALLGIIREYAADGRIELRRVIAIAAYNWGLTERKIREYLQILEDFGAISVDGDYIYVKSS